MHSFVQFIISNEFIILMKIDQAQIGSQNKLHHKPTKSFNNRNSSNQMQPYSKEFIKTKLKAFERYKQFYPAQDKQNLYQISKTPCVGFYVMKGYRNKLTTLKQTKEQNRHTKSKSSDKIIHNMIKKYLDRKEHVNLKQTNILPKIKDSLTLSTPVNRTSLNLKSTKHNARFRTEYQDQILRPSATANLKSSHLI